MTTCWADTWSEEIERKQKGTRADGSRQVICFRNEFIKELVCALLGKRAADDDDVVGDDDEDSAEGGLVGEIGLALVSVCFSASASVFEQLPKKCCQRRRPFKLVEKHLRRSKNCPHCVVRCSNSTPKLKEIAIVAIIVAGGGADCLLVSVLGRC